MSQESNGKPDNNNSLRKHAWCNMPLIMSVLLMVITVAVYLQVGNHQFINFDDPVYVTENQHIASGIGAKNIVWALTSFEGGNWNPVTWLSHMTDVQLYGMNPRGHHLTSVAIHTLSTLLLFLLLLRMTSAPWQSSFVAALFALHPLHVESVAWVAERKDVLSAFFWFLTLLLYVEFMTRRTRGLYILALLSFIAGLMAKPMLVTLPIVMLLIDFWPLDRYRQTEAGLRQLIHEGVSLIKEKIPFFACSLCAGIITIYAQKSSGALAGLSMLSLNARFGNALISYVAYIGNTLWPHNLSLYYPLPMYNPGWQVIGASLFLLLVTTAVVIMGRRALWCVVGWLWFVITLVPVIGIIQVGSQSRADRYMYLPVVGLFIMVAWGIPALLRNLRFRKEILALLYGVALLASTAITWKQLGYWSNEITLYRHALDVTTGNYMMHNNLGTALQTKGETTAAMVQFQQAIRINPGYKKAHYNLGVAFDNLEELDSAIREYQLALQIDPNDKDVSNNLGVALARKGYLNAAIHELQRSVLLNPGDPDVHFNLGLAYDRKGNPEGAMREYQKVLRIDPGHGKAQLRLRQISGMTGTH